MYARGVWEPANWADLTTAIGTVSEASDLDFKRELSSNSDVSKDIAAMTLQGGVIAYGIEEDAQSRASAISKIPLTGVPEKVQLLVNTTIAPVPRVDITVLRENPGDNDGVVVVKVPRSPFAARKPSLPWAAAPPSSRGMYMISGATNSIRPSMPLRCHASSAWRTTLTFSCDITGAVSRP